MFLLSLMTQYLCALVAVVGLGVYAMVELIPACRVFVMIGSRRMVT